MHHLLERRRHGDELLWEQDLVHLRVHYWHIYSDEESAIATLLHLAKVQSSSSIVETSRSHLTTATDEDFEFSKPLEFLFVLNLLHSDLIVGDLLKQMLGRGDLKGRLLHLSDLLDIGVWIGRELGHAVEARSRSHITLLLVKDGQVLHWLNSCLRHEHSAVVVAFKATRVAVHHAHWSHLRRFSCLDGQVERFGSEFFKNQTGRSDSIPQMVCCSDDGLAEVVIFWLS